MEERIGELEWFLNLATETAKRSTCLRRCYGAILVNQYNEVVATGYNGAPRNEEHCDEIKTCLRQNLKIPSGRNYEICKSVHAEQNACIQAGSRARGCTLYLAGFERVSGAPSYDLPCYMCTKLLLNAGVTNVITRTEEAPHYIHTDISQLYDYHLVKVRREYGA